MLVFIKILAMHLTQQTDYALRVLIYAAINNERLVNIGEIAADYAISKSHLMKVTTALVKGGFLEGIRGKGGGLRLAAAAYEINIGAVVRHMEPMQIVECMGPDNRCLITPGCQLAGMLAGATRAFLQHLDGFSLADLLNNATIAILYRSAPATKPPDGAI